MPIVVRRKVTRWGNGFGLRITKAEAERLGIKAGHEVDAEIFGEADRPARADLDKMAIFLFGADLDLEDLDRLAEEDALADL